jgi:hypothetical protein
MCGLLGAALAALLSCGPSDAEAMKLKEGRSLNELPQEEIDEGRREIPECPALLCADASAFCGEVLFEYGRSPPLCLHIDICDRMECLEPNRTCTLFEGLPAQVRCVERDD